MLCSEMFANPLDFGLIENMYITLKKNKGKGKQETPVLSSIVNRLL